MTHEAEALLSDLMDGVDVDPDLLRAALGEAGACDTLVAFSRLRQRFADEGERPGPDFYVSMERRLRGSRSRRRFPAFVPWAAAAALVAAVGAGVVIGRATVSPQQLPPPAAYCMDRSGVAHEAGVTALVDGLKQECVPRGMWLPVR